MGKTWIQKILFLFFFLLTLIITGIFSNKISKIKNCKENDKLGRVFFWKKWQKKEMISVLNVFINQKKKTNKYIEINQRRI